MVAVTYDVARERAKTSAPAAAEPAQSRKESRKGWFARFVDALIEARMQQARREIALHLPMVRDREDEYGDRRVRTDREQMPIGGW